jgi:hypothetical protein
VLQYLGWVDLATLLAERALTHARALGDPAHVAAATFALSSVALTGGSRRRSLAIAESGLDTLGDPATDGERTWAVEMHGKAAYAAGGLGQHADASAHMAEARDLARHIGSDPWRCALTPTDVDVFRVGLALENGEPDKAPEYARRVDRSKVRGTHNRSSLLIYTGRGHYAAGRPDDAVVSLLEADALNPPFVRNWPEVLEVVAQMVRDAPLKGGSAALRELARRCKVDPTSPEA